MSASPAGSMSIAARTSRQSRSYTEKEKKMKKLPSNAQMTESDTPTCTKDMKATTTHQVPHEEIPAIPPAGAMISQCDEYQCDDSPVR